MVLGRAWPRLAPPVAVQILALLVGGLVAAQVATLALSVLLPPPPPPEYRLRDIAAALRGGALSTPGLPPLERAVQARPPDVRSPGWQVSEASRRELARALDVAPDEVQLLFYSPPPFAGAEPRANMAAARPRLVQANLFAPLLMAPPPAGGGPTGGMTGPEGPGGGPLAGRASHSRGGGGQGPPSGGAGGGARPQAFDPPVAPVAQGAPDGPTGSGNDRGGLAGLGIGGPVAARAADARPVSPDGPIRTAPVAGYPSNSLTNGLERGVFTPLQPTPSTYAGGVVGVAQAIDPPVHIARPAAGQAVRGAAQAAIAAAPTPSPADRTAAAAAASRSPRVAVADVGAAQPLPPPVERTLFGLAQTPVVEGEFLAALHVGARRWVTVRPLRDPILSRWQRRVALWFLVSFAAVAPLGYLFSRRLAAPLAELADTADRLGRDAATPMRLAAGPPETRRLATAFAGMQARLQRHVDDRTAMVGAISHDLRTPLARLRFKLERAPPALKSSMQRDLSQMEQMLDSVLLFIRDASEPGPREMADLRSIVECVVDDAAMVGGDAALEPGEDAAVEVDILAVQRVVSNLVENALKYGGAAHVRLLSTAGEAVLQVTDPGPGLPDAELEKVFQPFYRSEEGRQASAKGIGLGLSVSRSIARAHGGDITLSNGTTGLVAELRLPLARQRPVAWAPERNADVFTPAA